MSPPIDHARRVVESHPGVQAMEATTQAWSNFSLTAVYIMIWLIYFVETLLAGITLALVPYVTSAFSMHAFTPTVSILSNILGGAITLSIAKIIDIFGRPYGLLFCLITGSSGLVMMMVCDGIGTYAAAMVFHTLGNNGVQYILSVLIADTTKLENRALVQALMNSTSLITGWVAGPLAQAYLRGMGWRWAFGSFSALVPLVTLPLLGLLVVNHRKARKLGLIRVTKEDCERNPWELMIYYSREFNAVGLVLASTGIALFLLPFNLYALTGKVWSSPLTVGVILLGVLLLSAFAVWEKSFASLRCLPYRLLLDRTVFGACLLCACLFASYAVWNSYFGSYLQVVQGLSVEEASYVAQLYTVVSVLVAVSTGYMIHRTGHFKTTSLVVGFPLSLLGQGFMMYFRTSSNIGYIIMCFLFISISQGVLVVTDEIAMLAAGSHEHVAAMLAIVSIFGNIGGGIGMTIAAFIWSDIVPDRLVRYLPSEELPNLNKIFGEITTQLSYPMKSLTRLAIQHAYEDAMLRLLLASTAISVVGIIGPLTWRNINVKEVQQNKGHV
jgi:MFS family permease